MEVVWIVLGAAGAVLLLLVGLAAFIWWKIYTSDEKRLARRIVRLQFGDRLALAGSLLRDPRVPPVTRLVAVALVLYLALPLDIVPDFVPVLGYLDDLLIVLVGAGLVLRTIPRHVIEEHVTRYEDRRRSEAKRLEEARR